MKRLTQLLSLALLPAIWLPAQAADSAATAALKARNEMLKPTITQLGERTYVASGYSPANVSMIVGDDGLIIVDASMMIDHADAILTEFRKISTLPIKAVILTHGHGDHTGGLPAFTRTQTDGSKPLVYARLPFNTEGQWFQGAGVTINKMRGARQGGFLLPPEKRINNGIAPAVYPPRKGRVFDGGGAGDHKELFDDERLTLEVAGVTLEMVAAPGETEDQLYVWDAQERIVFTGDNFYRSWPNTYAIRGTGYRNVMDWIASLDKMLAEKPIHAVGGHTPPLVGEQETITTLTNYRDAMEHVFNATIEGINQGKTPNQLVEDVQLPAHLAKLDYLQEYYGNVRWSVRAIFQGYMGWFDGNPTQLDSLPPKREAELMLRLAGGEENYRMHAGSALAAGDVQWAAQLADHLLVINPDDRDAKFIKAVALETIADEMLTATGRNYYLTVAQQLRKEIADSE
ncbi:alkyl/aryl-sulfatase [Ferrimonas pelagia]|uniref:Alkyl/aryl-sulfatase n=1 Tax=Ferrimonas pelagia TaxID=1177826 RepID=A0ABP9EM21_9GAMM